ncbi:hypothetical protein [Lactiplantibacillus plantarum]|uniref:hypothetical protein n=1 Tax=Lactiplantibacillus plantarum TaxID=1590 RepID=UPI0013E3B231|nr:hypothetical protein [Lactiplantibacillus plantarum]
MKVKIIPPIRSGKSPYVKEFDNWAQVDAYLCAHNEEIYESDPATEELNFRPRVIE